MKTGIAALTISALGLLASLAWPSQPVIPQCPEDAVLVGSGRFESGRYTEYQCGPAVDDYDPTAGRRWAAGNA